MGQEREIKGAATPITFAASPAVMTCDCGSGNYFTLTTTLTANVVLAVTNLKPGHRCYIDLTQDGTGGRTVSLAGAGGMTITGPVGAAMAAGAGARSIFEIMGISQAANTPGVGVIVNVQS